VAIHPPRLAKDHWLGKPLSYQLPNPVQAYLLTIQSLFALKKAKYLVLANIT